jgi:hypothetical protein
MLRRASERADDRELSGLDGKIREYLKLKVFKIRGSEKAPHLLLGIPTLAMLEINNSA